MENRIEQFANAYAAHLVKQEGADFDTAKQNAMDNANQAWNYLWWMNDGESRNICIEYKDVC